MKLFKKSISLLLVLSMLAGLVPVTAFAVYARYDILVAEEIRDGKTYLNWEAINIRDTDETIASVTINNYELLEQALSAAKAELRSIAKKQCAALVFGDVDVRAHGKQTSLIKEDAVQLQQILERQCVPENNIF